MEEAHNPQVVRGGHRRRVQQARLLSSVAVQELCVTVRQQLLQDDVSSVTKSGNSGRHCFTIVGVWGMENLVGLWAGEGEGHSTSSF